MGEARDVLIECLLNDVEICHSPKWIIDIHMNVYDCSVDALKRNLRKKIIHYSYNLIDHLCINSFIHKWLIKSIKSESKYIYNVTKKLFHKKCFVWIFYSKKSEKNVSLFP